MKVSIALVLLAAAAAHADADEARCQKGIELAKARDLPRAALYLDSCTDDEGIRVRNQVAHQLEGTQLSHVTITSMPAGQVGEIDALPGEQFTTPATVWVKAGTYKITVAGQTVEKTVEPHSRTTVIIDVPAAPKAPKTGVVDFGEEPEQHAGPPPAVKHGSMMPKKYLGAGGRPTGEQLDDPFARPGGSTSVPWRLGLRATGGVAHRTGADAHASIGLALLASRALAGPVRLAARLDWSHRAIDTLGANVGFAAIALRRPAFVLSAGAVLRGEVHVQDRLDAMEVNRAGMGVAVDVDLALLRLPLAFGLRGEHGLTELMDGVRGRALLVEVGYDWR